MAKRRGISPVIATVIIVAVTIAVAIAVAFWMTGIIGLFTGTVEKVEFASLYVADVQRDQQGNPISWEIVATLSNTGTTPVTVDMVFLNGIPNTSGWTQGSTINGTAATNWRGFTINPGSRATVNIHLNAGTLGTAQLTSGISLEVKFHTVTGKEYPKLITLP